MRTVLFYISGHGYGHAVRMGEVIRALTDIRPDWRILARTKAPPEMLPAGTQVTAAEFESGVVERQTDLFVDEQETVARLHRLLQNWDGIVENESSLARHEKVDLIVADIPPIAGDIAAAIGVSCIGISNFTWDWIYESYHPPTLARLEEGYAEMSALVRLPFAQTSRLEPFRRIVDAPLIARKSAKTCSRGRQRRVLLGSRVQVGPETIARAARELPEFEFVTAQRGEDFTAVLASCDVVIAKLGFSMVAECIAARKPLLYPPRPNFREQTLLQAEVGKHTPALAISIEDFYSGNWALKLRQLTALAPVDSGIRTDGAEFCARVIAES